MKIKILSVLAIISLMTACTNQGEIETSPASNNQNVSSIRSYSEALKIAQDAIPMLNDKATTRGESCKRKIDLNDKKVFKLNAKDSCTSHQRYSYLRFQF